MALTSIQRSNLEYLIKKVNEVVQLIQEGDLKEATEEAQYVSRRMQEILDRD